METSGKRTAYSFNQIINFRSFTVLLLLVADFCHAQTVDFTISNRTGCVPLDINFTDISSGGGGVASRNWYLDYNVPDLVTVGKNYSSPGTYYIMLTVTFVNGTVKSKTDSVIIHPKPVADFTTADTIGCSPLMVNFKDLSTTSTGTVNKWVWDLDPNSSNLQNPTQLFTGIRNYKIILFVENNWGCVSDVITKDNYIHVVNRPVVNFTVSPQNSCADTLTVFTENSSINGTGYLWNFGDNTTSTEAKPSHRYNGAGTYTISLSSVITKGCEDTKTKIINTGTPKAISIASPDTVCEKSVATFRGTVSAVASIRWLFTDRNQASGSNPATYIFAGPGTYEIWLIAQNSWGCADTIKKKIFVKPAPAPDFSIDTARSCKFPFLVQATNHTVGNGFVFTWDFGDGSVYTGADPPPHAYTSYGNYTITLRARDTSASGGCSGQIVRTNIVQVVRPSLSVSSAANRLCEAPKTFSFFASPVNFVEPVTSYDWDFGNGDKQTSVSSSINHIYTVPGTYTVTVTAFSRNSCTVTATTIITLLDVCPPAPPPTPPPPAPDTVIIVSGTCSACNSFTFSDTVKNSTVISWDMGDGTIINTGLLNPVTHLFPITNSTYTVTVRRQNNVSLQVSTTTTQVKVICTDPEFTVSKKISCINDNIDYYPQNLDTSIIYSYTWDFGDGNFRTIYNNNQPPYLNGSTTYKYSQLGSYIVKLTVTDKKGCSRLAPYTSIFVQGPRPDFSTLSQSGCDTTLTVLFKDSTSLNAGIPIIKWQWNYGDGTAQYVTASDTVIPKRYTGFSVPATYYNVSLLVTDSAGCTGSISKQRVVKLYRPRAAFSSRDTLQCKSYNVTFSNQSQAVAATYTWRFGDGLMQNIAGNGNATHTYKSDGNYGVSLLVKDENGCTDSSFKPSYVKFVYPEAAMSIKDTAKCWPVQLTFADSSKYAYTYLWDFGDGRSTSTDKTSFRSYGSPGTYTVRLIITGPNTCRDTTSQVVRIKGATGTFYQAVQSGCKPFDAVMQVVNRLNIASYKWDFGDGTPVIAVADDSIMHRYPRVGKYLPNVIYVSTDGCAYSSRARDSIIVDSARALFSLPVNKACDTNKITVLNSSQVPGFSAITKYLWSWGDGQTSNLSNPGSHVYTTPGIYNIQLAIESRYGCRDTFRLPDTVKVFTRPIVSISGVDTTCQYATGGFTSNIISQDSVTSVNWLINGAVAGSGKNISIPFDQPGSIPISLQVLTRYGCNSSISKQVKINPAPIPNASPDTAVCINSVIQLRAHDGVKYLWSPAGSLSSAEIDGPLATPPVGNTKYKVTVTNRFGCVQQDSVTSRVDDSVLVSTVTPLEVCRGNSVILQANGNAKFFSWTPVASLKNATTARPVATPDTTTMYTLMASGNNACPDAAGYVSVKVNALPTVTARAMPVSTNPGKEVQLIAEGSNDISSYRWSQSAVLRNAGTKTAIWQYPDTSTTFVVSVLNQAGCASSDEVTVVVTCTDSSFAVPNVFTPMKSTNRLFRPLGVSKSNPRILQFSVYNRWGQRVYNEENKNLLEIKGWDGMINGKMQDPGTYIWQVNVTCSGNAVYKKGTVILAR